MSNMISTSVETRPYVGRYNPYCLIANWNEDIHLAEAKLEEYLKKKEKGSLLVQRTNCILDSALTPVCLTALKDDGYIQDGSTVMIKSCAIKDMYLAASPTFPNPNEEELGSFGSSCSVTATHYSQACRRNTFVIRSVPEVTRYSQQSGIKSTQVKPILFGQNITISNGDLLLFSDLNDAVRYARKSKHQEVILQKEYTEKSYWKILPRDPTYRLEMEGLPVQTNVEIVINHTHTNRHLALENYRIRTIFGPDFEVSAHRYLDQYQVEEIPNIWKIISA